MENTTPTDNTTPSPTEEQQKIFVNLVNSKVSEAKLDETSGDYIFGLVRILHSLGLETSFRSPTELVVMGSLPDTTAASSSDSSPENIQVNYILDLKNNLQTFEHPSSFLDRYLVSALQTADMRAIAFFMGVYAANFGKYTNVRITETCASGPIPYTFLLKAEDSTALAVLQLFEKAKIPLNSTDVYGNTLAMCLVTQNNLESLRYLLSVHPELASQTNIHSNTLLDVVKSRMNLEEVPPETPSRFKDLFEYLETLESSAEMNRVD